MAAAALASATLRTIGHLPATTIGHRLATAAQTASSVRSATTIGHRQAIDTASSIWVRRPGAVEVSATGGPSAR